MRDHVLDRPVWAALTSTHAHLAEGDERARRYRAGTAAFLAARDDDAKSLAALEALVQPGERLFMLQAGTIALPPGLVAAVQARAVQMVAERTMAAHGATRITELGATDIEDMLALAELTKPGPFTRGALALGRFWGVRIDGRLAAMAGERMRQTGFTEISGVCTHPDFRGWGLARLLSVAVVAEAQKRGDTPYLHAYASNAPALRLYESIGFRLRCEMSVAVVERA